MKSLSWISILFSILLIEVHSSTVTYDCTEKRTWLDCLIHNITLDNESTLQILPNDKLKVLKFQDSEIHTFPGEMFEQVPQLFKVEMTSKKNVQGLKEIRDFSFANASSLIYLEITGMDLTAINENTLKFPPGNIFRNLEMMNNNITSIHPNAFDGLHNLGLLDLSLNPLEEIHKELFSNLTKLDTLRLSGCRIKALDSDIFVKNTNLISVDLSHNSLETLELSFYNTIELRVNDNNMTSLSLRTIETKKRFVGMCILSAHRNNLVNVTFGPNVKYDGIYLESNNFTSTDDLSLGDTSKLHMIALAFSPLKHLTNLTKFANVKRIYLGDTAIEFRDAIFRDLTNLERLDLSRNSFETINLDYLRSLDKLKSLNLERNQLKTLDYENISTVLPQLEEINLEKNIFPCTYFEKMRDYLETHTKIRFYKRYASDPLDIKKSCIDVEVADQENMI